jgi:hypothetical protein
MYDSFWFYLKQVWGFMKKILSLMMGAGFLLPSIVLANCPAMQDVTYRCNGSHCQWTAPWWEGYQGHAEVGEHPTSFLMVFWGPVSPGADMGSAVCFYRDRHGGLVELSQNNWGGLLKPTASVWTVGEWPGPVNPLTGMVCADSVSTCAFNYGV